jgi:hypothetical protein
MRSGDAFHRLVVPRVLDVARRSAEGTSVRSTFGLGLPVAERKRDAEAARAARFCLDFRLPLALRPRAELDSLGAAIDAWHRRQQVVRNTVVVEVSAADAVSRLPAAHFARSGADGDGDRDALPSHVRLRAVRLAALAVDPSPLFEAMGLERPLRDRLSDRDVVDGDEGDAWSDLAALPEGGGGGDGGGGSALVLSHSSSLRGGDQVTALAPDSPAHALASWRMRGASLADYRRAMYRIGTDSVFSVGAVARPVSFASINLVSCEAEAALRSAAATRTAGACETGESLASTEAAWSHAMQGAKRALEAASPLMNERCVISIALLRRRVTRINTHGDTALDAFVRELRAAFGATSVVPIRANVARRAAAVGDGDVGVGNDDDNGEGGGDLEELEIADDGRLAAAAAAVASSMQARFEPAAFEPVLVVCGGVSGGANSRGTTRRALDVMPSARRVSQGELTSGGNGRRLVDHVNDRSRRAASLDTGVGGGGMRPFLLRRASGEARSASPPRFRIRRAQLSSNRAMKPDRPVFVRTLRPSALWETGTLARRHGVPESERNLERTRANDRIKAIVDEAAFERPSVPQN